jgi:hypothetical protein
MKQALIWTRAAQSQAPMPLEVLSAIVLCVLLARLNQNKRSERHIICS